MNKELETEEEVKLYWRDCIYPLFLSTLGSCTYTSFTDAELQDELDNLALRAVAKFKFPKVSLDYVYDYDNIDMEETPDTSEEAQPGEEEVVEEETDDGTTGEEPIDPDNPPPADPEQFPKQKKGYYFTHNVTIKEIRVILSWMKVFWVEYQLSKEKNYQNLYADKDVKAFSSGNLISSIDKAYNSFITFARKDEEDYGRVTKEGRPAIGDING